jgi:hypothetical protein
MIMKIARRICKSITNDSNNRNFTDFLKRDEGLKYLPNLTTLDINYS